MKNILSALACASTLAYSISASAILPERLVPLYHADGEAMNNSSRNLAMSNDGRFVVVGGLLRDEDRNSIDGIAITDMQLNSTKMVALPAESTGHIEDVSTTDISGNGRFLAIQMPVDPITTGGSTSELAYLYDVVEETWTVLTHSYDGSPLQGCANFLSNHAYEWADVSDTGLTVFSSLCSNLVPNDSNGKRDVFAYDPATGVTTLLSHRVDSETTTGNGESINPRISDDGRFAVFASFAQDITTQCGYPNYQNFLYDFTAGETTKLTPCINNSSNPRWNTYAISGNGNWVLYTANSKTYLYNTRNETTEEVDIGLSVNYQSARTNVRFSYDGRFLAYYSVNTYTDEGPLFEEYTSEESTLRDYLTIWDRIVDKKTTISTHYERNLPIVDNVHNEVAISGNGGHIAYGVNNNDLWLGPDHTFAGELALYSKLDQLIESSYDYVNARSTEHAWSIHGGGMRLIGNHTWETFIDFDAVDNRLKFDIGGDWTLGSDFGDNNQDGIADVQGAEIVVNEGAGRYRVLFNDQSRHYRVTKLTDQQFSQVYMRGSFNGWATQAMAYQGNNVWESIVTFASGTGRFKFDIEGDWSNNFGDTGADGVLDSFGSNIEVAGNTQYLVRFFEASMMYTLTPLPTVVENRELIEPIIFLRETNYTRDLEQSGFISFSLNKNGNYWAPDGNVVSATISGGAIGAPISFSPGFADRFTVEFDVENVGVHTMTLEVETDLGLVGEVEFTVMVTNGSNQPPISVPGQDIEMTLSGGTAPLVGHGSYDPDGAIASYAWRSLDPIATIVNPSASVTSVQVDAVNAPRTIRIGLIVTDSAGEESDESFLEINLVGEEVSCAWNNVYLRGTHNAWQGNTPMACIGNGEWEATATFGNTSTERFKFDRYREWSENYGDNQSSGNTTDSGIAERSGGDIFIGSEMNGATLRITFNETNKEWTKSFAGNQPPVADAGEDITIGLEGGSVTLDGSGSYDPDGPNVNAAWVQTSGMFVELRRYDTLRPEIIIPAVEESMTLEFRLTVSDAGGLESTDTVQVFVQGVEPNCEWDNVYLRGSHNGWSTNTPMVCVGDGLWERGVFFLYGTEQFKFDRYGDWSTNYGENGASGNGVDQGEAELGGGNILVGSNMHGRSVTITFHERDHVWTKMSD